MSSGVSRMCPLGHGMCQILGSSAAVSSQPPATFGVPRVRSLRLGPLLAGTSMARNGMLGALLTGLTPAGPAAPGNVGNCGEAKGLLSAAGGALPNGLFAVGTAAEVGNGFCQPGWP